MRLLLSTGTTLLVTTRRRCLPVDPAQHVEVAPLAGQNAVELLTRYAGAARTGQDPDAVREVVRVCDELPLALRIVAGRIPPAGAVSGRRAGPRIRDRPGQSAIIMASGVDKRSDNRVMSTRPGRLPIVPGHRWRQAGQALLWIVLVGLAMFTGLGVFGLEVGWPVVAALAYTPYVVAGSLVAVIMAAWLTARRLLVATAVCAVVLTAQLVPPAPSAPPALANGQSLRVMAVNMYGGGGDARTVVRLAHEHRVDVLAVLELTEAVAASLATTGIDALLPYQDVRAGQAAQGSGIYAKSPFTAAPELEPDSRFEMPAVRLQVPGTRPVEVMAVHVVPPLPGAFRRWRRELRDLPAQPEGAIRILAGDFNATLDHSPLRNLIATGYIDAAEATGQRLLGTWRSNRRFGRFLPPVPIDRVLVDTSVTVDWLSVHHVPGSDHRAVIAQLILPVPSR